MPRTREANRAIQDRQRANLLAAAGRLFLRGGPLTMENLAKEAGVSQGLPYRYFRSKDELFDSFLRDLLRAARTSPAPRDRRGSARPRVRLEGMIDRLLERRRQHPEFFRYVFRMTAAPNLSPEVGHLMGQTYERLRSTLRRLISEAQAEGEVAGDDPEELTAVLLALVEGISGAIARAPADGPAPRVPATATVLRLPGPAPSAKAPRARVARGRGSPLAPSAH